MDPYTLKNLADVEDSAQKFGFGELGEVRFATGALETRDTGLSLHRLNPGCRQAFGHRHENAEEVYVVIAGSGRIKLDEEVVKLNRLDAVRVDSAVTRACEAGADGMEFLVFGPLREGDGELVHGWWSD